MTVHKCDICCELIEDIEIDIRTSGKGYQSFDLCEECARPITDFLSEAHLTKDQQTEPA